MKVLAFDSSSLALSVAILQDQTILAQTSLNLKQNHSVTLMPTIDFLMQSLGWTPQDLDRIAVAQGPGSYTGLRMAVATAKTLAYTLGIDLVGVSSLQALTDQDFDGILIPLIDARRNHVYAGFYANGRAVQREGYLDFNQVLEMAAAWDQVCFVGEVANFSQQIAAALPQAKICPTLPSASLIGRLAQDLPPVAEVHDFVPNYLKRVEAEENWLKEHDDDKADYIKWV
ncbi:tRNA (adenosine(37)-N6)-threonylcarbamoyltransferase complex dimerization subunit type 1 TsaB [Streptococcus cuniculipharyngis]|uniref:tRNA (Adenosine(37)-N6)-threonylcarbamoyltransferase complex dimerization subunit type 1 TsaB n=1 Tax=Streptococcus cuniculipharyngis TaxID=1562651 RepID=A0A5C5SEL0_9STRE|nr:tRNA (adenosine(37)-N6)-threonylcarbamoyltransferase complex dimerization subunit type 1 TsaB [Streptococcus cuniculipharyngis]TWS98221.1 tRNA (adenosine(37)-N6)-threonylcarbamoyltransferase complex dimerization subunit type 1 TsaB [Streptococcus cuniculipharyngis]